MKSKFFNYPLHKHIYCFKKLKIIKTFSVGIINPKLLYIEQSHKINTNHVKPSEAKTVVSSTHEDDFFCCIQPLLQFGRLTGIIPITGLWNATGRLIYK